MYHYVVRKEHEHILSRFRIGRDEINLAEDIKLLGVTLDKDLNFDKQKADIARKVGNQMRVLQRHKKLIDTDAKIRLYILLIFCLTETIVLLNGITVVGVTQTNWKNLIALYL